MILGLGHDVVRVDRIEAALARWPRFAARCFTAAEHAYCTTRPDRAAAYARRWAAKEAVVKALGSGVAGGVFLRDVEVARGLDGRPGLVLHNGAAAALAALGAARAYVSLTDDPPVASAVVILEV